MVDLIGPNRINSITRTKAVTAGKTDKTRRDKERPGKDPRGRDSEKKRVGGNIDEHC